MQLVIRDGGDPPFLTQAMRQLQRGPALDANQWQQLKHKAALMSLKFADKFYNQYKLHLLEQASYDVIGISSLGLLELSQQDATRAAGLLRQPDGLMKAFQKGWSMLTHIKLAQDGKPSLYGEVDAKLLNALSCPPDADDWQGWQLYQAAKQQWGQQQALLSLKQRFFADTSWDPHEFFNVEDMLAQILVYRLCCPNERVRGDLKRRLRGCQPLAEWQQPAFLTQKIAETLQPLSPDLQQLIQAQLGESFVDSLAKTLAFAVQYQQMILDGISPEKRQDFEFRASKQHPLLGWPHEVDL